MWVSGEALSALSASLTACSASSYRSSRSSAATQPQQGRRRSGLPFEQASQRGLRPPVFAFAIQCPCPIQGGIPLPGRRRAATTLRAAAGQAGREVCSSWTCCAVLQRADEEGVLFRTRLEFRNPVIGHDEDFRPCGGLSGMQVLNTNRHFVGAGGCRARIYGGVTVLVRTVSFVFEYHEHGLFVVRTPHQLVYTLQKRQKMFCGRSLFLTSSSTR